MTPAFVAELVRAANEIDKITPLEVTRLLHRAIVTIRDLRESMGITGSGTTADEIIGLYDAATDSEAPAGAARAAALLKAAHILRTLHVASRTGTRVWIVEQAPLS
ncbi:hypothetical protein AMJ96_CH02645 [Rhizobium sp. N113]|uniref:hypothetical protein n=1 Tax=unclassified Rhizobium TaxID=2613769 RepID=UPI0007EBD2AE|nr:MULTISPECIES: hypothetical protein [unclassified Rhizobium]ANL10293.1 hypothetical protein AMJ98_CH02639 [Rhizobium sp. N1341]ANL22345.1 hypothetical protein AMJ96_CH02645 [Rhizobium sp. N113]ANM41115.1 hypothetical protein AMK03_CH02624 [Rhizobium sp. N741]